MAAASGPIELAQTGKRDYLKDLEKKYQARWEHERVFDVAAPTPQETAGLSPAEIQEKYPKWFGNFPYPYMNGSLHLGHAFTISKIEFAAGFQRMLGKRVLFPHGFHCTGMPIKAASDKIIREMEMFGQEFEKFNADEEAVNPHPHPAPTATEDDPTHGKDNPSAQGQASQRADKAKKGKIAAKSTGLQYQFQIMDSIGVPREEIKKFADPYYWLEYFPPICVNDHKAFGSRIDWRRSFITTDANPYYDSFVRWQTNKLHSLGKIKFGERYTVYSPKDGQPCMDHDRAEGEALGPQEYTGVKMAVIEPSEGLKQVLEKDEVKEKLGGRKVCLVAATLRPETMYGQTNCFVGPALQYGIYIANDKEAFVCTHRAARNMAFQGTFGAKGSGWGDLTQVADINGKSLVGTKVHAPLSAHQDVWVLPMETVLATKGTGVVTSVPSDSPDDYATLMDLRKKPAFYGVDPKWVSLDPIPVIQTPAYGEMSAPTLYQKLKINSAKDAKQLAEAKDLAYKEGFYNGVMLVGEWKGESVQEAKGKVKEQLVQNGEGLAYAEPEGNVVSRSGDDCVVALMDQWYLDYGEQSWREQAEKLVARMETYNAETRNGFEGVLAWLNKWACARTYGLGSKLPWDPQFLVESLSDSTIYMAYYTVAHFLHNNIKGSEKGSLDIAPEQLTDEVWDYIFRDGPWPENSPLPKEKADIMKHEFLYFYPFDIRSSGKDLIPNHLTFCVYVHAALFPPSLWPKSMRTNGHLMLNGQKMSKSKGNTLTMREAIEKFGSGATRLSLADAGDGIEDANFDEKTANASVLRLHTLSGWCEEMVKEVNEGKLRTGEKVFHDKVFEHEINELINITYKHYDATNYKDALKYGFYELQSARDWYREATSTDTGMHADLVLYWIRIATLLVLPVAPHFSEHVWSTVLGEKTTVQKAAWPTPTTQPDRIILDSGIYMRATIKAMRDAEVALLKKSNKSKGAAAAGAYDPKKPKSVRVYVANSFPEWQNTCVSVVKESYDAEKDKVDDAKVRELLGQRGLGKDKRVMPFIQAFKKRISQFGADTAFNRTVPFSEADVLQEIMPYIKKTLNLVDAEVITVEVAKERGVGGMMVEGAEPGSPAVEYYNV